MFDNFLILSLSHFFACNKRFGLSFQNTGGLILAIAFSIFEFFESSKVSDNSVATLSSLKSLEEIYLWNSEVTKNGIERLRKALPDTKISF